MIFFSVSSVVVTDHSWRAYCVPPPINKMTMEITAKIIFLQIDPAVESPLFSQDI